MLLQVFGVYDSKARSFSHPFYAATVPVAIRMFQQACNDPETLISKHPEDFTLFHIARWNDDNAVFEPFQQAVNLGLAANFKEVNHGPHAQQPIGDETQLQPGSQGGNSKEHIRP